MNKWKVEFERTRGRTLYRAYRLVDPTKDDIARNREYYGQPSPDRAAVEALAERLNEEAAL